MTADTDNALVSNQHDPQNPRWFQPPEQHKPRPPILVQLSEALRAYYDQPATRIPGLNAANRSDRQQRSQRRETCIRVLCALIHYTDLVTLRVGTPQTDGSMQGITMRYIAKICGLGLRCTERAMADLVKAGLVTVYPIAEKVAEGVYKGRAAIRTVNRALFALFGLDGRLEHEQKQASARRREQAQQAKAAHAKRVLALQAAVRQAQTPPTPEAESDASSASVQPRRKDLSPAAHDFFATAHQLLNVSVPQKKSASP